MKLSIHSDYMNIRNPVYLSHSAGRYAVKRFRKAQCPIIERLTNSLMMNGRNNGKKLQAVRIVDHAFSIIHLMTDQNPVQVAVDAIVNCGPREDSTRIGSAGTVRRQAVDVSPLRRVNQAIALLTIGAREASFRNVKSIAECLAEELINAAKGSSNSYAIKKKDELERYAKAFFSNIYYLGYQADLFVQTIVSPSPTVKELLGLVFGDGVGINKKNRNQDGQAGILKKVLKAKSCRNVLFFLFLLSPALYRYGWGTCTDTVETKNKAFLFLGLSICGFFFCRSRFCVYI